MTKLIPTPAGAVRLCLRRSRSSRKLNLIETVHVGSLDFFNSHDRLREMRLRSRKGSRAAQSAPMADCEHVTSGLDGSVAHYFRCKSTVSGDDRTVQNVHPIRETDSCSATDSGSNQDRSTRTSEPDPLCEAAQ